MYVKAECVIKLSCMGEQMYGMKLRVPGKWMFVLCGLLRTSLLVSRCCLRNKMRFFLNYPFGRTDRKLHL